MILQTHHHAHIDSAPSGTKRFHAEHMRRIPVQLSEKAKQIIDLSTHQGRLLPQALAEFFGTLPDVEGIEISTEEKDERFMIDVKHGHDEEKHCRFFMSVNDLHQVSEQPRQGFEAARTAQELQRLYRVYTLKEGA